jgi:hypothetical protein
VVDSNAFRNLRYPAKALLIDIARQFRGDNNGRLIATAAYLAPRGWTSDGVIARALKELLNANLLYRTVLGHRPNKASWFALTWYALDPDERYDFGVERDFLHYRGAYQNAPLTPPSLRAESRPRLRHPPGAVPDAHEGDKGGTPAHDRSIATRRFIYISFSRGPDHAPPPPSGVCLTGVFISADEGDLCVCFSYSGPACGRTARDGSRHVGLAASRPGSCDRLEGARTVAPVAPAKYHTPKEPLATLRGSIIWKRRIPLCPLGPSGSSGLFRFRSRGICIMTTIIPAFIVKQATAAKTGPRSKGGIGYQVLRDAGQTELMLVITGNDGGGYTKPVSVG